MISSTLLLMILLPLAGAALNGLILRTPHTRRAGVVATSFAATSFLLACALFFKVHNGEIITATTDWFEAGSTKIVWGFVFDQLTAVMALVVTGIGTLIHLYSIGYMSEEPTPSRYFAYLNLFLFAMLTLISASNLVVMFVGWEGVGLCSYLLIGYWYKDLEKANAGMKAFLVNRIGDAGFLIGIFLCLGIFGSTSFQDIQNQIMVSNTPLDVTMLNWIAFFLFIGAMGKSAQIPLHVWLPDAMAGPTPVSALIHAATMVTAGIYLIVRMNFLFTTAEMTSQFIAITGISTALLAAFIAVAQSDIKKVLAYSTVSQLGLMFLALGTRSYFAAFFHVLTHAFFKALLFLGSGSVIHACHGEQNIHEMGGLRKSLPITHLTFLIGTLAIAGVPPLAGFFSKDLILYGTLFDHAHGMVFWILGLVVSGMTAFYMARVYTLTFLGEYRGHAHPHESPVTMSLPLITLAVGSAIAGFLSVPHAFHLTPDFLGEFLRPIIPAIEEGEAMIPEFVAMGIATALGIGGVILGIFVFTRPKVIASAPKGLTPLHVILENKFFIDELYQIVFIRPFQIISGFLARFFDVRIIDGAVLFPARLARIGGSFLSLMQVGLVQFYLLVMVTGAVIVLWVLLKGMVL